MILTRRKGKLMTLSLGRYSVALLSLVLGAAQSLADSSSSPAPQYRPQTTITDTISSWGSKDMAGLLTAWQQGFSKHHPEARYTSMMKGNETAQAALYTEAADLAFMDREILLIERHVLLRRKHHLPFEIVVAKGSYRGPDKAPALAVFVHKDNPIGRLTIQQLDGIFGDFRTGAWDNKFLWHPEFGRSAAANIRTWGQLGAKGEWANQPIQTYGYPGTSYSPLPGEVMTFRAKVMKGGDTWNPTLREYETGQKIAQALDKDRFGIGYASLADQTGSLKPIAIARAESGPYVELTKKSAGDGAYPLTRAAYVYIDHGPNEPLKPKVKEFLAFMLSEEGQRLVAQDGGYLPLSAQELREQLNKLK